MPQSLSAQPFSQFSQEITQYLDVVHEFLYVQKMPLVRPSFVGVIHTNQNDF